MLHITNGDHAVGAMRASRLYGDFLPWRDCLNEGPVPAGMSLENLSQIRARFIASWGLASEDEAFAAFEERDRTFTDFSSHEEVVLWFEHDLYDQLQLAQILDWLSRRNDRTRLSLICIDRFEGIEPFRGISQLTPASFEALFDDRHEVYDEEFWAARDAWAAFTADSPFRITDLLQTEKLRALPFMENALKRHLEEFPSIKNGLSRTEQWVVERLSSTPTTLGDLFQYVQNQEKAPYWGDSLFYARLSSLQRAPHPLVAGEGWSAQTLLTLTETGHRVFEGASDHIKLNGVNRWLGGAHLKQDQIWRWDGKKIVRD